MFSELPFLRSLFGAFHLTFIIRRLTVMIDGDWNIRGRPLHRGLSSLQSPVRLLIGSLLLIASQLPGTILDR